MQPGAPRTRSTNNRRSTNNQEHQCNQEHQQLEEHQEPGASMHLGATTTDGGARSINATGNNNQKHQHTLKT